MHTQAITQFKRESFQKLSKLAITKNCLLDYATSLLELIRELRAGTAVVCSIDHQLLRNIAALNRLQASRLS
jgi:hypothetical protein